jgi:hypothetical protein
MNLRNFLRLPFVVIVGLYFGLGINPATAASVTYPIVGATCPNPGATLSSTYDKYTCTSVSGTNIWSVKQLSYKSPSDYLKGFAIGQQLLKADDSYTTDLACIATANDKLVQHLHIQPGQPASSTVALLNTYWGYMGCWDGDTAKLNTKAPNTISLPGPVYPTGDSLTNYMVGTTLNDGSSVKILQDMQGWNAAITSACSDSSGDGQSQNCLSAISSFEYPGAFDQNVVSSCVDSRVQANWTITDQTWLPQTMRWDPGWQLTVGADPTTGYGAEHVASGPYTEVPFEVLVLDTYHDDNNGDFVERNWHHFIYKDGQLYNFVTPCVSFDESAAAQRINELPTATAAPAPVKAPAGKVDKSSNAYKTMFNVGKNFAKVSTASDSASSQCSSALQSGMIRNNGIPQYLGMQAQMIQSYLRTASGYQGCLDGFGH